MAPIQHGLSSWNCVESGRPCVFRLYASLIVCYPQFLARIANPLRALRFKIFRLARPSPVKNYNMEEDATYRDYKKFPAETRITGAGEVQ